MAERLERLDGAHIGARAAARLSTKHARDQQPANDDRTRRRRTNAYGSDGAAASVATTVGDPLMVPPIPPSVAAAVASNDQKWEIRLRQLKEDIDQMYRHLTEALTGQLPSAATESLPFVINITNFI